MREKIHKYLQKNVGAQAISSFKSFATYG